MMARGARWLHKLLRAAALSGRGKHARPRRAVAAQTTADDAETVALFTDTPHVPPH